MKNTFLYYCRAFVYKKHGKHDKDVVIKGFDPEIRGKLNDIADLMEPDESIFVIDNLNFESAIARLYVDPALKEQKAEFDNQLKGKVVIDTMKFLLCMMFAAALPLLFTLMILKETGVIK